MATSAATLTTIIATLSSTYKLDAKEVTLLLSGKGLIPKKMLVPAKVAKETSKWASKAAEALAEEHGVQSVLAGTGKGDKITVKDIKTFLEGSVKKPNASPAALKYARDNKLDVSRIASGSGKEGKIVLKDVQELEDPDSEMETDSPQLSPSAAKLVKQYDLDDEDLSDITGTGREGKILAKDLAPLIKEIESE